MQKSTSYFFTISSLLWWISIGVCGWHYSHINAYAETASERYDHRVENICKPYESEYSFFKTTTNEKIPTNSGSISLFDRLDRATELHVDNMDGIYQCGILELRKNTLENIDDKLLKWISKTWIGDKIRSEINRIQLSYSSLGCNSPSDESINKKIELLKQTTYELCSHHSYLEYLREYANDLWELITEDEIPISRIPILQSQIITQIDNEIDRSYTLFDLAYSSYWDYENYFTIHLFLELIKEDVVAFRRGYHNVINPINQVIYKISNATRLP